MPLRSTLIHSAETLLPSALVVLAYRRSRFERDALELARQAGYDDGYADGCDVSRVVKLRRATSPLGGASHEFGEQRDFRGGADRVG